MRRILFSLIFMGISGTLLGQGFFDSTLIEPEAAQAQQQYETSLLSQASTSSESESVPSLSLIHYFEQKLFGSFVWYISPALNAPDRGRVVGVNKDDEGYYYLVIRNDRIKLNEKAILYFHRNFDAVLRRDTNPARSTENKDRDMFAVETERSLNSMIGPLVDGTGGSGEVSLNLSDLATAPRYTNPLDSLSGEKVFLEVKDSEDPVEAEVVVYKNQLLLKDGTPIKISFER